METARAPLTRTTFGGPCMQRKKAWMDPALSVGSRPGSLGAGIVWIVTAAVVSAVVWVIAYLVLALPILPFIRDIAHPVASTFVIAWAYWIAVSAASVLLALLFARRLPALSWALWWVILLRAAVGLVSSVPAVINQGPGYGAASLWWYDFAAHRWSWPSAQAVGSAITLVTLAIYTVQARRAHRTSASSGLRKALG